MIEDYGTLSEEELLEEILQEVEENTDLDISEVEFKFEVGKLHIQGALQNEEELENLIGVLENHIEPEDYELEIDLAEGPPARRVSSEDYGTEKNTEGDNGKILEESLEEIGEDEMDFVDEEGFEDEEKW